MNHTHSVFHSLNEYRSAVSPQVYAVLEEALIAKDKAERDLKLYTNLVII